jgi:hypothetical protein
MLDEKQGMAYQLTMPAPLVYYTHEKEIIKNVYVTPLPAAAQAIFNPVDYLFLPRLTLGVPSIAVASCLAI